MEVILLKANAYDFVLLASAKIQRISNLQQVGRTNARNIAGRLVSNRECTDISAMVQLMKSIVPEFKILFL